MHIYYTDMFNGGRKSSRNNLSVALEKYYEEARMPRRDDTILESGGGKPYIEGGPEFSISHSRNYWAVLIDDVPCGLDVQVPKRADHTKIAARFYSSAESALVEVLGEEAFFKIWARREALVKCVGRSVFTGDVPELLMPPDTDCIKLWYDGEYRAVFDLDLPIDLYVSICKTVNEDWEPKREAPLMRRLSI